MSERSFALWSVALAIVFGMVVPEPGKPGAPSAAVAVTQPPAQPQREKTLEPMQAVPFAVSQAVSRTPDKAHASRALLWAVNHAP